MRVDMMPIYRRKIRVCEVLNHLNAIRIIHLGCTIYFFYGPLDKITKNNLEAIKIKTILIIINKDLSL